ncbi:NAD-dependent epimerase/dehydratase family protein [Stenotrophomonas sp. SI-NJAU-1]|uniref:NAD-dependent epimerase/dehydratase family protein n=1 Tax=unclassified Stenotrophomonas TaxID=196198 RepID=UPI000E3D3CF2|nr:MULTISPECIES: NAD-dependent epimerase/dehydratase family protein [unclassified Stenotrophomonas]UEX19903.1 NAD-dependent epimerase/dehydratase family protein [Stenotrophomonas sp. SI-NJAU-1]
MKVLITGGAGFIGSALARALVARGDQVTVLDNLSPQIHGDSPENSALLASLPTDVVVVKGDVRLREDWLQVLPGQDVVVHLAAETGTGQSMYEIDRYVDVNVRGTSLFLDLIGNKVQGCESVKRVVVASSRSIYGEGKYKGANGPVYPGARVDADLRDGVFECRDPQSGELVVPLPTDEESRIHPSSIYGITKQVQEQLVLVGASAIGIQGIALRYQNVYGPGQSLKNPYTGILSIFSTLLLQGKGINIFEDGKETRDFVFIDDVVAATVAAIDADVSGQAFNVGTGEATDVITVASALKEAYGRGGEISISGNYRIGDIRHNFADLSRVEAALGYHPRVTFAEGVKRFAAWVLTQQIEDSGYQRSVDEMRAKGLLK